jgi:hypothetical protein
MRLEERPQEFDLNPLKKLFRPYFSPQLGSWEVDVVFAPHPLNRYDCVLYLFCININTKFLRVFLLGNSHKLEDIYTCIAQLIEEGHYVSGIRGDGEFKHFDLGDEKLKNGNIQGKYYQSSPFDNHNRVVDRVIRTIKDAVGQNYYDMRDSNKVQQAVEYYNLTPHESLKMGNAIFTPNEVEKNKELEGVLIRKNKQLLEVAQERQAEEGLFSYEKGYVLLIHLDFSRTVFKFMKKRRVFNALAIFEKYEHGDVVCRILRSGFGGQEVNNPNGLKKEKIEIDEENGSGDIDFIPAFSKIKVPVYYTKFVCKSISELS